MNFIKASTVPTTTTSISIDPCLSNPCTQNNGLCMSSGSTYACMCISGEPCTNPNTCQNGGICASNMDCTNNCTCLPGFTGALCQSKKIKSKTNQTYI